MRFICKKCGKESTNYNKIRTFYKNNKRIFKVIGTNIELKCVYCNGDLKEKVEEGNFTSSYSEFGGLSPLEKQKILRKRSREDAKRQKYVEQEREKEHFNG